MKSYLITDPSFYTDDPDILRDRLRFVLQNHCIDYLLFRDKQSLRYRESAEIIQNVLSNSNIRFMVHSDPHLAYTLGAYGVHLTSMQFHQIAEAKALGLFVIISTHTHEEAVQAESSGADAITYSPIFYSPGKGDPKGLEDLKEIVDKIKIPIFALGGIVAQEQIDAVERAGAYGFASIRYFTH